MSESQTSAELKKRIDRLVRPRSVALVGISEKPGSLGRTLLSNLESAAYSGAIYLVNPKRPVIDGRTCLDSIEKLPPGIDCVVLAIPGAAILDAARACASRGVGSLIVFSAGFAESGAEGLAAQRALANIAREHEMIVEGPNCLGMVNYRDGIPLTFIVTEPQAALEIPGAAILSQSGALAAVVAVNMRHHQIPLSYSISTGNEAANGLEDFLEYLIDDPQTRVIAVVAEQIRQPQRFLALARQARAAGQFVVLLHPGRSSAARASAATHTGAMAGNYDVMKAITATAGVVLVETLEALVDVTQLLVRMKAAPRGGLAVFTESGAFKALTLDLCDSIGLELPALSGSSLRRLREALPPFIPPSNPLDITAQGLIDPDLYCRTLPAIFADEQIGSVLLAIILTDPQTTQLKMPPILDALRKPELNKPIVFAALDEGAPFNFPALRELRDLGVACFPSPERAIRALGHVTELGALLDRIDARQVLQTNRIQSDALPQITGTLTEFAGKKIVGSIGVRIPRGRIARSLEEAIAIGKEIGYPVAVKAQSTDLPHKSEFGAVLLNVKDENELAEAWAAIEDRVEAARPGTVIEEMLIEEMASKGLELIVGARRDPEWGPVLVVGSGGVLAEAMRDVCVLRPEATSEEIIAGLEYLQCGPLLSGFRGSPALDTEAVARTAAALGRLMLANNAIEEIEINPLVVYERGRGAMALDALVSLRQPGDKSNTEGVRTHE